MKILINERLSEHKYKTPEGYLICTDAILARTGKQEYRRAEVFGDSCEDSDGVIEIDRREEEVFSPQTLASFENKPITVEHPDVDVNSDNYKDYAVGFVRDVKRGVADGQDVILGTLVITDRQTIEEIENGEHTDLSCGYDCDIVDEDNPQQRNIRGNHVALCAQGRAGIARIVDSKVKDDILYPGKVFTSPKKVTFKVLEVMSSFSDVNGEPFIKVRYEVDIPGDKKFTESNSVEVFFKYIHGYYDKYVKDSVEDSKVKDEKEDYYKFKEELKKIKTEKEGTQWWSRVKKSDNLSLDDVEKLVKLYNSLKETFEDSVEDSKVVDKKFVVYNDDDDNFGSFNTREEAKKQIKELRRFDKENGNPFEEVYRIEVEDSINDAEFELTDKQAKDLDKILRKASKAELYFVGYGEWPRFSVGASKQDLFEDAIAECLNFENVKKINERLSKAGLSTITDSVKDDFTKKFRFENEKERNAIYEIAEKTGCKVIATSSYYDGFATVSGLSLNIDNFAKQYSKYQYEHINDSIKDVNPIKGESKEEFIQRFMEETKSEYPDEKQRYAVANSYWNRRNDSMKDAGKFYIITKYRGQAEICESLDKAEKLKNSSTSIFGGGNIYEVNSNINWYRQTEKSDGQGGVYSDLITDIRKGIAKEVKDSVKDANIKFEISCKSTYGWDEGHHYTDKYKANSLQEAWNKWKEEHSPGWANYAIISIHKEDSKGNTTYPRLYGKSQNVDNDIKSYKDSINDSPSDLTNIKVLKKQDYNDFDRGGKHTLYLVEYIPQGALDRGDNRKLWAVIRDYKGEKVWTNGAIVAVSYNSALEDFNHQLELGTKGTKAYLRGDSKAKDSKKQKIGKIINMLQGDSESPRH